MPGPYGSPIVDALGRADGPLGASWVTPALGDAVAFAIAANQLVGGAPNAGAAYTGQVFGPDCEVFIQVPVLPTAGNSVYLGGRVTRTDAQFNGYQVRCTPSTGTWVLRRIDLGSSFILGASFAQAFAAGNWLCLACILNNLEAWFSTDAVTWAKLATRVDGAYTSGGYPAVEAVDAVGRYANLGAGTIGTVGARGVGGAGRSVSSDK